MLKLIGRYSAISLIAMYLTYFVTVQIIDMLGVQSQHLMEMNKVLIHSNNIQEQMLGTLEKSNDLHRIRYGMRLENIEEEVLN